MTPSGTVRLHIGSSSQDIRLTERVRLTGGTCDEGSDLAATAGMVAP